MSSSPRKRSKPRHIEILPRVGRNRAEQAAFLLLLVIVTVAGIGLRHGVINHASPTFDEPIHLIQGLHYQQTGQWPEFEDRNPPGINLWVARTADFWGEVKPVRGFIQDKSKFSSPVLYRFDLLSKNGGDHLFVKARVVFQVFTFILLVAGVWLGLRFDFNPWAVLVFYAFLMLDPTFVGLTSVVTSDAMALALGAGAVAMSLSSKRVWQGLSVMAFSLAWFSNFTLLLYLVPLAIGVVFKKVPPRSIVFLFLGFPIAWMLAGWIGWQGGLFTTGDPDFRLSYLDGRLYAETPFYYFLQTTLLKTTLAGLVLYGLALKFVFTSADRRLRAIPVVLAVSLIACSWILPGLGHRLVLPLAVSMFFLAASQIHKTKTAAIIVLLLAAETVWNSDRMISYQNPLAGETPRALDSNTDWGQGFKEFATWWKAKGDTESDLAISLFGGIPPEAYGIKKYRSLPSYPQIVGAEPWRGGRFPGYVAASLNNIHGYILDDPSSKLLLQRKPLRCFRGAFCVYDIRDMP